MRFDAQSQRFNEIIGFGAVLGFWLLLTTDATMRADLVSLMGSDLDFDGLTRMVVVGLLGILFLVNTLVLVVQPWTIRPKLTGDLEIIAVVLMILNALAGGFSAVHQFGQESGLRKLLPVVSGLLTAYEFFVMSDDTEHFEQTDRREATRWHLLLTAAVVLLLYQFRTAMGLDYWADALAAIAGVVTVTSAVLVWLLPLRPHGWRLRTRGLDHEQRRFAVEERRDELLRAFYDFQPGTLREVTIAAGKPRRIPPYPANRYLYLVDGAASISDTPDLADRTLPMAEETVIPGGVTTTLTALGNRKAVLYLSLTPLWANGRKRDAY